MVLNRKSKIQRKIGTPQAQAETELIARYQTKLDLFAPYSEQLDQAYALLNSAIGFRWRQPDSTALG